MSTARGQTRPQPGRPQPVKRRVVRRQVTVRRIDPWSVLKLSLIFYSTILVVVMLGLVLFWSMVTRLGVVEEALTFLEQINLEVAVNAGNIGRALFLIGLLNVVLWSGINVFLTFLYNLVADLLGGLRVTLAEEEPLS